MAVSNLCKVMKGIREVLDTNKIFQIISADNLPGLYVEQKLIYKHCAASVNVYSNKDFLYFRNN